MNSKWIARMLGLLLLIVFFMLMLNLQKQLVQMQQMRGTRPAPATTT